MYSEKSGNMTRRILQICKSKAGSAKIICACRYAGSGNGDVLLVIEDFPQKIKSQSEVLNGSTLRIFLVDRWIFERDVENGWFGEYLSEKITFLYEPIVNRSYLQEQSLKVKTRIVRELLENLVVEYPDLSKEFLIKPEYFIYETILRRIRLFPLAIQNYLVLLEENGKRKVEKTKKDFIDAANRLSQEGLIRFENGNLKMEDVLTDSVSTTRMVLSLFKNIRRTILRYAVGIHPEIANLTLRDQVVLIQKLSPSVITNPPISKLDDPENYVFLPTHLGYVPLSERTTKDTLVNKKVIGDSASDVNVSRLGGVLNSVFLVSYREGSAYKKVVVKRFDDWTGFKWFPLAIWALGTRAFTVSGKRRMEREYSMKTFLNKHGFPVPRILYLSPKERLIFEEYIEGENLVEVIKEVVANRRALTPEYNPVGEVGRRIAEAHALNVALGDCKPENVIVAAEGKTWFVDLEQGMKNGDVAWDLAEFLYFTGHYVSLFSTGKAVDLITEELIKGYVNAGGDLKIVRKAASIKYSKVFSLFTPPQILRRVSNHLQKT